MTWAQFEQAQPSRRELPARHRAHPPPPTPPPAHLQAAFRAAIDRFEYQGVYNGVFPVKCNHDKDLIQAVVDYGGCWAATARGRLAGWLAGRQLLAPAGRRAPLCCWEAAAGRRALGPAEPCVDMLPCR